jgi:hypothetical protein
MIRATGAFLVAAVLNAGLAQTAEAPADILLSGGRVWTADPARPWAEAVAIRGNRIVYVGDLAGAEALRGERTQVIPVAGRLVTPGFNDAHIHLSGGALSLERVDLIEDQDLPAVQARIKAFAAAQPGRPWVLGRGWLYGAFPGGLPSKEQLDAAVPDRPAYMECYDGHSGWANSRALQLAGITRDTKDPEHGVIVRDPATGEPTGALKETATALLEKAIPVPEGEARYELMLRALRLLSSQGITSVQDAGGLASAGDGPAADDIELLARARREGKLSVRVAASVVMEAGGVERALAAARRLRSVYDDPLLRVAAVKGYVDGVIEAHTAAMLSPYERAEFGLGLPNWEPAALNEAVVAADKQRLQVYLHAIGDRGVRLALDAHQRALEVNGARDRRGRIEHIETIHPDDYPRFKALGVIASQQPLHANPDRNSFEVWQRNIGPERASRGFSWRNIEKAGGRLAFGSDWPVVTADVFRGLYCAVTRMTREGTPSGGWRPELAVSLESALRFYTAGGAYASFEEDAKGSLGAGKLADVVVLSEDLFASPPERILASKVLLTIMDGRIVHRAPGP